MVIEPYNEIKVYHRIDSGGSAYIHIEIQDEYLCLIEFWVVEGRILAAIDVDEVEQLAPNGYRVPKDRGYFPEEKTKPYTWSQKERYGRPTPIGPQKCFDIDENLGINLLKWVNYWIPEKVRPYFKAPLVDLVRLREQFLPGIQKIVTHICRSVGKTDFMAETKWFERYPYANTMGFRERDYEEWSRRDHINRASLHTRNFPPETPRLKRIG